MKVVSYIIQYKRYLPSFVNVIVLRYCLNWSYQSLISDCFCRKSLWHGKIQYANLPRCLSKLSMHKQIQDVYVVKLKTTIKTIGPTQRSQPQTHPNKYQPILKHQLA